MYKPIFTITPRLLNLITQSAELKTWIEQTVIDVSWLPILQKDTSVRLAHSSTAIEGNPLTLPEVTAISRGESIGALPKDKQEIKNYLNAMKWIWSKKASSTTKIKESDLLRLHKLITENILPIEEAGSYKTRQNKIIDHNGHLVHTPPPPKQVQNLTIELLTWLNSQASANIHSVIVSAITHHQLVSIHPFIDGNGRISRALAIWILYLRGFDTHHLFALDEYYEMDRQSYYHKIQQARDLDHDLTYWLEYVAEGIVTTLKKTKERILSLQININRDAKKLILTKRQEDVLRFLRDHGRVKSFDIEKAFKITRARVNQIIQPLVSSNLVTKEGQTRATTYRLS